MELFYHECLRLYGDRILMKHDLTWFMETLKYTCMENFDCCKSQEPEGERIEAAAKIINTSDEEGGTRSGVVASMDGTVRNSTR